MASTIDREELTASPAPQCAASEHAARSSPTC